MAGLVTFPFDSLYHAAKFGLQGWSEGMSYELKPFGIRIKSVAPGFIKTAFASNMVITSAEPYRKALDHYVEVVSDPAMSENGSTPEQILEVVYEAATDGTDQISYIAGLDAQALYTQRLKIGSEAAVKEMEKAFLG